MANVTDYTDDQVAHAMAVLESMGGNAKKAAATLGIPRTTLRAWAGRAHSTTGKRMSPKRVDAVLLSDNRQRLAKNWERVGLEATELLPSKLQGASAKDLAVVAGIATEKLELLSGRATSRSESLRIELVAGGSLKELAERTMSVRLPLPRRADIVHSTIDSPDIEVLPSDGVRTQPKQG